MAEQAISDPFAPPPPESVRAYQRFQAHLRANPRCHCGRAATTVPGVKTRGSWSHRSLCDLHKPVEKRVVLPAPRSTYSLRDSLKRGRPAGPTDAMAADLERKQRELNDLSKHIGRR